MYCLNKNYCIACVASVKCVAKIAIFPFMAKECVKKTKLFGGFKDDGRMPYGWKWPGAGKGCCKMVVGWRGVC